MLIRKVNILKDIQGETHQRKSAHDPPKISDISKQGRASSKLSQEIPIKGGGDHNPSYPDPNIR